MLARLAACLVLVPLAAGAAEAKAPAPIQTVHYACDQGKALIVQYFDGPTRTAPNGMPLPGGHVVLTQAGGVHRVLQQTPSGSGIRYADPGETFVFWSKGDGAFVEEGPKQTVTFANCVAQK